MMTLFELALRYSQIFWKRYIQNIFHSYFGKEKRSKSTQQNFNPFMDEIVSFCCEQI